MNWKKHDDYAIKSEDGRYSICSVGIKGGRVYEVYRTRSHENGLGLIATRITDAQQARDIAEAHEAELRE
jgi:hypothetical protein